MRIFTEVRHGLRTFINDSAILAAQELDNGNTAITLPAGNVVVKEPFETVLEPFAHDTIVAKDGTQFVQKNNGKGK